MATSQTTNEADEDADALFENAGFSFDAENSDDELDANDADLLSQPVRVDWGEFSGVFIDDVDAAGLASTVHGFDLGSDGALRQSLPATSTLSVQWKIRAESTLVAKVSREMLAMLAAAPEAEQAPELREKLMQRISDADAFGTRAMATFRQRQSLQDIQTLLAEGLVLGVETRELVQVQQCVRQAQEVQSKLAAFDYCEEQMDLRSLKGILNEMERIPVLVPEEQDVRERWSKSNAWLHRAKAILSSPRRTRQGKQDAQGDSIRQRFALPEVEALLQQSATLPLICNRKEVCDLSEMVNNFVLWREEVRKQVSCTGNLTPDEKQQLDAHEQQQLSGCLAASRESYLTNLAGRGAAFPIECEEFAELNLLLWTSRAQAAVETKTSLKDLIELCDKAKTAAAPLVPPQEVLRKLEEKRGKAEDWVKRAKGALSKKWKIAECNALLQEASALEVDSEEAFLIEYQLEAAESWSARVQAQLALSLDDADYKVLKALLKESDRIAVRLDSIRDSIETRMDELERKEQEESECEWAKCDACNKWRRLGKDQHVAENDKFFCQNVAKTCDDAEDEWDAEKEEITRLDDAEHELESDADDDVSLADRKLMLPDTLVYAQYEYYPFWPARIRDPDADYITGEILKARRHGSLLVQFLGKSMGSGLKWIDRRKLVPFKADADPNNKPGMRPIRSQDYKAAVQAACDELTRLKRNAKKRERKTEDRSSSSSEESTSSGSSSDYSDSSVEEVIDYGEEFKWRAEGSGSKRQRERSAATRISKGKSLGDLNRSKRKKARREEKRLRKEGASGSGSGRVSKDESDLPEQCGRCKHNRKGRQYCWDAGHAGHLEREAHEAAAKDAKRAKVKTKMESKVAGKDAAAASESKPPSKDAAAVAAAASASEPLFPKWFTQLPSGWQGSYTNYSAIRDSEANLKQRLSSLSTPEDIRREVRNMVFCAFISALALETFSSGGGSCGVSGSAASSASSAGTASASQSAQNIEKALFTGCGGTITADYRRRYRLLAMALRSSQHLRAALARCALTPASLVAMSCAELDAYGKVPATSNNSKQAAPLPSPTHKLKEEAGGVKALPLPSSGLVKLVPPLKTPSFLPEVKSKGSGGTSRGASPEYHSLEAPSPQGEREPRFSDAARAKEDLQQRSPQPESKAKRKEQEIKAERNEEERKAAREAKAEHSEELAIVGEVSWVGVICKVESNTQVRVKAVSLQGARMRAVGRVPETVKVVGRMPPDALAKFLSELSHSRSRQQTVVRFELDGDGLRKSADPAAVKAYNRLVEEYESKGRVGVVNLPGQNEFLYLVGPSCARRVLRLDAPRHLLYGVFVMRIGQGGERWSHVHMPGSSTDTHTNSVDHPMLHQIHCQVKVEAGAAGVLSRGEHVAVSWSANVGACAQECSGEQGGSMRAPPPRDLALSGAASVNGEGAAVDRRDVMSGSVVDSNDVMSAYDAIKALLKATESNVMSSQGETPWKAHSGDGQAHMPQMPHVPHILPPGQAATLPPPHAPAHAVAVSAGAAVAAHHAAAPSSAPLSATTTGKGGRHEATLGRHEAGGRHEPTRAASCHEAPQAAAEPIDDSCPLYRCQGCDKVFAVRGMLSVADLSGLNVGTRRYVDSKTARAARDTHHRDAHPPPREDAAASTQTMLEHRGRAQGRQELRGPAAKALDGQPNVPHNAHNAYNSHNCSNVSTHDVHQRGMPTMPAELGRMPPGALPPPAALPSPAPPALPFSSPAPLHPSNPLPEVAAPARMLAPPPEQGYSGARGPALPLTQEGYGAVRAPPLAAPHSHPQPTPPPHQPFGVVGGGGGALLAPQGAGVLARSTQAPQDPSHAHNLQQLSSLSTEHLISLLISNQHNA